MNRIRHLGFAILTFGFAALLSGCKLAVLNPHGMIAADEKNLMITATCLMLAIVVPVIMLTFFIAWRYRASNEKAVYSPEWSHSTLLEIIWWTIPCVIIGILGMITWVSSHTLDPYKPLNVANKEPIIIQAISLQWKWLFIYPKQNIATINYVEIPVNVPVRFMISAEGPMNSLQIPQLAGQVYAMAGMQTRLNLIANAMGDYAGQGTNFTGDGFSEMKFVTHVASQDQFDSWVKQVKQSQQHLTTVSYNQLVQPSENNPVSYYSSATQGIFNTVVMKTMMPMPSEPMQEMAMADASSHKVEGK